jgi:putative nucleotidyltransferase with HDIG domain
MAATLLVRESREQTQVRYTLRQSMVSNLERTENYPTLSDTTVRVMALANNPHVSVSEVATLVRRDGVIAATVLKAANSCIRGGRKVIEDVQQAVLRLGLQDCCKLLCTMGMKSVYNRYSPTVRENCNTILRHSLFVARLASGICRDAGLGNPGLAFTAGLLHDIGRVVACVTAPDDTHTAKLVTAEESEDTLQQEREAWGIDHCAIGFQFATKNNLPEAIIRVAFNHHRPAEEQHHRELVSLIAVVERLATHVQRKHNIVGYNLVACPHFPIFAQGWTAARATAFHKALPNMVVQAIRDTRAMLKSVE